MFKKNEKRFKKYKYRIVFKNGTKESGTINAYTLKEAYNIIGLNRTYILNDSKHILYYNRNEMIILEIEEED